MLTRYDPFRDMFALQNIVNRVFDEAFSGSASSSMSYEWSFPMDVAETADHYLVKAALPGLKSEDLEITYNQGTLTIKGEVREETEKEQEDQKNKARYHLRERRFGSFQRAITLPVTINADAIEASYEDGILTLTLPKSEEVKPKRIPIRSGQKMIESSLN